MLGFGDWLRQNPEQCAQRRTMRTEERSLVLACSAAGMRVCERELTHERDPYTHKAKKGQLDRRLVRMLAVPGAISRTYPAQSASAHSGQRKIPGLG